MEQPGKAGTVGFPVWSWPWEFEFRACLFDGGEVPLFSWSRPGVKSPVQLTAGPPGITEMLGVL